MTANELSFAHIYFCFIHTKTCPEILLPVKYLGLESLIDIPASNRRSECEQ